MKTFKYQAINKDNKTIDGNIDAEDDKHARQLLRHMGLLPTKIVEKGLSPFSFSLKSKKISQFDITVIMRELAELLTSGLPVVDSLEILSQQIEKRHIKTIILEIRRKVKEGYSLSQAMDDYKDQFDSIYRSTIAAGEESGNLSMVVKYLADYAEEHYKTSQKIQQALIYPALMTLISIGIVVFLLVFVFPKFISIFEDINKQLPLITRILLDVTYFFKHYYILFLSLAVVIIIGSVMALRVPQLNFKKDQLLLSLPLFGEFLKTIYAAQFTHILGLLVNSGVAIVEAVQISAKLIHNKAMQQSVYNSSQDIREGKGIAQTLRETGFFSTMTINFIANGEASGHLGEMLGRVADIHSRHISRSISIFLTLFEPMLILVMGTLVLFIVLAMLLPMLDITQMIA